MTEVVAYQYLTRHAHADEDLAASGLSHADVAALRVNDLDFAFIPGPAWGRSYDEAGCREVARFIERYEWLGKMSPYPTERFVARYNGILAGAVIMDKPNAFSRLMGRNVCTANDYDQVCHNSDEGGPCTRHIEKLISRGASISWAPGNLASSLLMRSMEWMVHNTDRRLFVGYSDPAAGELGVIYQAAGFMYLGQRSGTAKMYRDRSRPEVWFSSRAFRSRAMVKRIARSADIEWDSRWQNTRHGRPGENGEEVLWSEMPRPIAERLRTALKDYEAACESRDVPAKGKYAYLLGRDKRETRDLRAKFARLNPSLVGLEYPKERQAWQPKSGGGVKGDAGESHLSGLGSIPSPRSMVGVAA